MATTANYAKEYPDPFSATYQDLWGYTLNTFIVFLDSELVTRTANYNFADFQLIRPLIRDGAEVHFDAGNVSGAVTINYETAHWQRMTLTGNVSSLTISNPPATGIGGFLTLECIQDGTGSRTLTLLNTVYRSVDGSAITLTTTAGATDKLRLETRNAGTNWDIYPNYNIRAIP